MLYSSRQVWLNKPHSSPPLPPCLADRCPAERGARYPFIIGGGVGGGGGGSGAIDRDRREKTAAHAPPSSALFRGFGRRGSDPFLPGDLSGSSAPPAVPPPPGDLAPRGLGVTRSAAGAPVRRMPARRHLTLRPARNSSFEPVIGPYQIIYR